MKLKSILAVTVVTALFISLFSVNVYAAETIVEYDFDYFNSSYFVPSPEYPNAEALPYGTNTLIYELYQRSQIRDADNNTTYALIVHRFFLDKITYNGPYVTAFNGATTCFVSNNSGDFESFVASTSTVYYQRYIYAPQIKDGVDVYYFSPVEKAPYYKSKDGQTYNFKVLSGKWGSSSTLLNYCGVAGNYEVLYGGRDLPALISSGDILDAPSDELPAYTSIWHYVGYRRSYPTSGDIANAENNKNNQQVIQHINEGVTGIVNALSQNADAIINAGSDIPSLNTDNEWMNDSLTKMNEWLSQMNDFKQQMDDSAEENASNMAQAKSFLTGLFDVIPPSIIAVLTLFLVMIVVVKVVGR